ncbi:MAG: S8 family peptidase [Pseudomonadota bacterium]
MKSEVYGKHALSLFLVSTTLALTACGGSSPTVLRTPPPTAPAPAPTPTPVPTPPAANFDTPEYRASNGATAVNALTAYEEGAFGQGVKVGVVDSGINTGSSQFTGRIDPASRRVSSFGSVEDTDGHGTSVSAVIAAAADGRLTQGVAPQATIVAARADAPNSCTDEDGCSYLDLDIAEGIDLARNTGARVVNLSLGGSPAQAELRDAIDRATADGMIVVISAGNDELEEPDPLAFVASDSIARGRVLIAGSIDADDNLSDFSNQAGTFGDFFFSTLGSRVASIDEEDELFLYSGTSYAAPALSGALAVLFSGFPNLTADEAIEILARSARDLGDTGVDAVFGRGAIDLDAAFRPIGGTSLAGSEVAVGTGPIAVTGGAAGDGGKVGTALTRVTVLDDYDRAFAVDLSSTLANQAAQGRLAGALLNPGAGGAARLGPASLSLSVVNTQNAMFMTELEAKGLDRNGGRRMVPMTGIVSGSPVAGTTTMMAHGIAPGRLVDRFAAPEQELGWLADGGVGGGLLLTPETAGAIGQAIGSWTFIVAAGSADAILAENGEGDVETFAFGATRSFGPVDLALTYERQDERETFLGSRGSTALGIDGANSDFLNVALGYRLADDLTATANLRGGLTDLALGGGGLAVGSERLRSSAFSVAIQRQDTLRKGDLIGLRVSQPLRIEGGALRLGLPSDYDYATGETAYRVASTSIAPSGREIAFEAGYARPFGFGLLQGNLFYRTQPGHVANAAADLGVALRVATEF